MTTRNVVITLIASVGALVVALALRGIGPELYRYYRIRRM
jgi:hypothetical protein